MHLQQNARGSGWEPCLNGSAVDAAWFETDWLPNLQAAHAAAVLFSDKYRAEFSVALAREARKPARVVDELRLIVKAVVPHLSRQPQRQKQRRLQRQRRRLR